MKRITFVLVIVTLLMLISSCDGNSGEASGGSATRFSGNPTTLTKATTDSLCVANLKFSSTAKGTDKALASSVNKNNVLSYFEGKNIVPVLFRSEGGDLISLEVDAAVAFDQYILADITGILKYSIPASEVDHFSDSVSENEVDYYVVEQSYNSRVLIDTLSKKVVEVANLFPSAAPYDSYKIGLHRDYILIGKGDIIYRINRSDLSTAKAITSDNIRRNVQFIYKDYILTGDPTYNSTTPIIFAINDDETPVTMSSSVNLYTDSIIVDSNGEFITIGRYGLGGGYPEDNWYKYYALGSDSDDTIDSISFGQEIRMDAFDMTINSSYREPLFGIQLDSSVIENLATTYNDTFIVEGVGVYGFGSKNDLKKGYLSLGEALWRYEWAKGEYPNVFITNSGYYSVLNTNDTISMTFTPVDYDDYWASSGQTSLINSSFLVCRGRYLFYLDTNKIICRLDLLTGNILVGASAVNTTLSKEWITIGGNTMIYKELTSGSSYVTKMIDLNNLSSEATEVGYSTGDIIMLNSL